MNKKQWKKFKQICKDLSSYDDYIVYMKDNDKIDQIRIIKSVNIKKQSRGCEYIYIYFSTGLILKFDENSDIAEANDFLENLYTNIIIDKEKLEYKI